MQCSIIFSFFENSNTWIFPVGREETCTPNCHQCPVFISVLEKESRWLSVWVDKEEIYLMYLGVKIYRIFMSRGSRIWTLFLFPICSIPSHSEMMYTIVHVSKCDLTGFTSQPFPMSAKARELWKRNIHKVLFAAFGASFAGYVLSKLLH